MKSIYQQEKESQEFLQDRLEFASRSIGRPKLTEPYKPLQISVPERLHEQCKAVVKEFVKMNNTKCVTQNVI